MQSPDCRFAVPLGLAIGLLDGFATTFFGIPTAVEFAYWVLAGVVAVALVDRRASPAPFLSLLVVFVVSGVAVGSMQFALSERYLANYPDLAGTPTWAFPVGAVGAGLVWGALTGLVAWGLARRRARLAG